MARERELRWRLEQEPELAGLRSVAPAEPPLPRPSLRESVPCVATATSLEGRDLTLVCTTGVDLDLVGFVADVQARDDRDVMVVLPSRDLVPITEELLGLLDRPVELCTVG